MLYLLAAKFIGSGKLGLIKSRVVIILVRQKVVFQAEIKFPGNVYNNTTTKFHFRIDILNWGRFIN